VDGSIKPVSDDQACVLDHEVEPRAHTENSVSVSTLEVASIRIRNLWICGLDGGRAKMIQLLLARSRGVEARVLAYFLPGEFLRAKVRMNSGEVHIFRLPVEFEHPECALFPVGYLHHRCRE